MVYGKDTCLAAGFLPALPGSATDLLCDLGQVTSLLPPYICLACSSGQRMLLPICLQSAQLTRPLTWVGPLKATVI